MSTAVPAPRHASISDDDVGHACELVRRICSQVGPGTPGTPQERLRAEILRGELVEHAGGGGTVPGAIDNLAASAIVVGLARFFARHPELLPAGTEVRFVSFGSEEAGLRGSRAYVAQHLGELQRLRAQVVNIEMVADPEIAILTSDLNGTVACSRPLVDRLAAVARRLQVPFRLQRAYVGVGTDAATFSKAGVAATTLLPFRVAQLADFYHQPSDRPERLDPVAVRNVLQLACAWIEGGAS